VKENIEVGEVSFPRYDVDYIGRRIRSSLSINHAPSEVDIWERALLFALDRHDYVRKLENKAIIVADRWTASNAAYLQAQTQSTSAFEWVEDLEFTKLKLPRPAVTILVAASQELQSDRLTQRAHTLDSRSLDQFERNGDLQDHVRAAYSSLARNQFGGPWYLIDNSVGLGELEDKLKTLVAEVIRPLLRSS
jgi:dTMP kinase